MRNARLSPSLIPIFSAKNSLPCKSENSSLFFVFIHNFSSKYDVYFVTRWFGLFLHPSLKCPKPFGVQFTISLKYDILVVSIQPAGIENITDSKEVQKMKESVLEIRVNFALDVTFTYQLSKYNIKANELYDLTVYCDKGNCRTFTVLEDVSRDYGTAVDYAFLFAKETVTPENAVYIMDDILAKIV